MVEIGSSKFLDWVHHQIGKPRADNSEKPAVWIDAGIHAREWIAPATLIYTIYKVKSNNAIKSREGEA